jgi:acylphosphatase
VTKRAVRLLISGRVQGVFYRRSAYDKALELSLKGYVRNLSSGDVEALVSGNSNDVQSFITWAYDGPKFATIANVHIEELTGENLYPNFTIRGQL